MCTRSGGHAFVLDGYSGGRDEVQGRVGKKNESFRGVGGQKVGPDEKTTEKKKEAQRTKIIEKLGSL